MMTHSTLQAKQRNELNQFPIAYAFNEKQLADAMKKLGASGPDELTTFGGGSLILKTDTAKLLELYKRHEDERTTALRNDQFLLGAMIYELGNHEYCITRDPDDALEAVGIDPKKMTPRELKMLAQAHKTYWAEHEAYLAAQGGDDLTAHD